MTSLETQIVTDYELNGTPIEVLAQDYDIEPAIIKLTLSQNSPRFRSACENKQEEDINQYEFDQIRRSLLSLALNAESEAVRSKVGIFLYNEKKGRNEKDKGNFNNAKINILLLNQQLKQSRDVQIQDKIIELKEEAKQIEEKTSEES